jgi:hypothetical protein
MVDMGMGQQDCTERLGVEAQISVLPVGLVSTSLKQPTIKQQPKAWYLKHVAATCHRARGSMEREFYDEGTPLWRLIRSQAS